MRKPDFSPTRAAQIYTRYWRGERTDKLMVEYRCSDQTIRNIADKAGPYGGPDYTAAIEVARRTAHTSNETSKGENENA